MASKKSGTPRKKAAKKKQSSRKSRRSKPAARPVISDPRAMEKIMLNMHRLLNEQEFETVEEANAFLRQFVGVKDLPQPSVSLTPLEQAQDKMYEAWDASGKRREKLAREALEISPDCADAYVLLAEETARTPEEARDLYEQGVKAGERALGAEAFEQDTGEFWGILETRPYMRARAGLAETLWALGERQQAIEHYKELLRLNPGDNQGNRYLLTHLLLKEGRDEELGELLDQYKDDAMAEWLYTRALWLFRREGAASRKANKSLREAFEQNRFVPLYLTGLEEPPRRLPEYIGFGDDNEAIHYVVKSVEEWLDTPGALEWFASIFAEALQEFEKNQSKQTKESLFKRR